MNKQITEWIKMDLHHHTSKDKEDSRKKQLLEYKKILDHFYENKGCLIVITDHDKISIESFLKYKEYCEEKKYNITILAGCELSFELNEKKGDVIFIFKENKKEKLEKINEILEKIYKKTKEISKGLKKIINELIDKRVKFLIMPHFHKGVDNVDFQTMGNKIYDLIFNFDLLEANKTTDNKISSIEKELKEYQKKTDKLYTDWAIVFGTDAHNFKEFKQNFKKTPYYFTQNSYEGLVKLSRFQKTRCLWNGSDEPKILDNWIKEIKIKTEKKEGPKWEKLNLGIGLNTIIGRKGTGKSYLIKLINNAINNPKKYQKEIQLVFAKKDSEINKNEVKYLKQNSLNEKFLNLERIKGDKEKDKSYFWKKLLKKDRSKCTEIILNYKNKYEELKQHFKTIFKENINFYEFKKDNEITGIAEKIFLNIKEKISNILNKEALEKISNDIKKIDDIKNSVSEWTKFRLDKIINLLKELKESEKYKKNLFLEKYLNKYENFLSVWKNKSKKNDITFKKEKNLKNLKELISEVNECRKNFINLFLNIKDLYSEMVEGKKKEIINNETNDEEKLISFSKYVQLNQQEITNEETFFWNFFEIFWKIETKKIDWKKFNWNNSLKEKKRKTGDDTIDEWFEKDYKYYIDGQSLEGMSYGEKQEKYIEKKIKKNDEDIKIYLLDQPEDDLDALTVKKAIIEQIKSKSNTTQWIVVTHDPKIVINSDSRNIILSNYNGEKKESGDIYRNTNTHKIEKKISEILDINKHYPLKRFQEYGGYNENK